MLTMLTCFKEKQPKRLKLKVMVGLWAFFMSLPLFAEQTISVSPNATVTARIAVSDLNRIAIEGERIQRVKGLEGQYLLSQDTQRGEVYIKPLVPSRETINLFLTTEQSHTYQLHLLPKAKSSETIVLKPQENVQGKSVASNGLSIYEAQLIGLIHAMAQGEEADNYRVTAKSHAQPIFLTPTVSVTLMKTYQGDTQKGDVYVLQNHSDTALLLTEAQFYRAKTLGIALEQNVLGPHQSTLLYTVQSHG